MTTNTTIPAKHLHELDCIIKRVNKTAQKLHLQSITTTVLNKRTLTRTVVVEGGLSETEVLEVLDIQIDGEIPHISGYEIIATTDATEAGNVIYTVPGHSVPLKFRTRVECDHCHTNRKRKYTVILRNGVDGTYIQVGYSCLQDFFPHISNIESMVNYATTILSMLFSGESDGCDEEKLWSSGGGEYGVALDRIMDLSIAAIRKWGWVSSSKAYDEQIASTKDNVNYLLHNHDLSNDDKSVLEDSRSDETRAETGKALKFYTDHLADKADKSDYEHNLSVLFQIGFVTWKNTGFAVSMIQYIRREMAHYLESERQSNHPSQNRGTVGKREVFSDLMITNAVEIPTQYGVSTLYLFRDVDGNVFKWFASAGISVSIGDTVTLKATVKAHEVYKGQNQTVISRAVVV